MAEPFSLSCVLSIGSPSPLCFFLCRFPLLLLLSVMRCEKKENLEQRTHGFKQNSSLWQAQLASDADDDDDAPPLCACDRHHVRFWFVSFAGDLLRPALGLRLVRPPKPTTPTGVSVPFRRAAPDDRRSK